MQKHDIFTHENNFRESNWMVIFMLITVAMLHLYLRKMFGNVCLALWKSFGECCKSSEIVKASLLVCMPLFNWISQS